MGAGVDVGATEPTGDANPPAGVAVDGGRAGAVGQLASAGMNGVGDTLAAPPPVVGLGDSEPLEIAEAVGVDVLVGVGAGAGLTTYGVYEGHG